MVGAERPWRLFFDQESRKSRLRRGAPLSASRVTLVEAVTEAREFSRQHGIGYVGTFAKSLSLFRSRSPTALYHPDVLPAVGYSLDARRVVAAATRAWVFGAWGWGDRSFESDAVEAEFWRVDTKLRLSVWGALVAAANSFDGSQSGSTAV